MLPSLARLLVKARDREWLPDDILDTIDEIVGSDYPCNWLRKLCETRRDLCSEEIYRAACRHFRYDTEAIRDAFLNTRPAHIRDAAADIRWRVCFRQLCARPKLTDADFPGQLYNSFFNGDEARQMRQCKSWVAQEAHFEMLHHLANTAVQQFQGAVDVAANNQWTHPRYGHISYWDVSQVTDMSRAFRGKHTFNENINLWDVSSVTDMGEMFQTAWAFNQPLNWDVSSVTNMKWMFRGATSFNQPLDWDVSSVTDMGNMFEGSAQDPLPEWYDPERWG